MVSVQARTLEELEWRKSTYYVLNFRAKRNLCPVLYIEQYPIDLIVGDKDNMQVGATGMSPREVRKNKV